MGAELAVSTGEGCPGHSDVDGADDEGTSRVVTRRQPDVPARLPTLGGGGGGGLKELAVGL